MPSDADSFSLDVEVCGGQSLDPPLLRVYLASALTNLDDADRQEAQRVRKVIRDVLHGYDYFGIRFEVYDPAEVTAPGSNHTDDEVYITDHDRTSASDAVIFYVLAPSLGVGMEAQIAADCTLPRVVVSRRNSRVSRMFRGVFSPTLASLEYDEVAELHQSLSLRLLDIAKRAVASAKRRRAHVEEFSGDAPGRKIMRSRLFLEMSLRELAAQTDIREVWLQRLEREPSLATSITLIQVHRIAAALGASISQSPNGIFTLRSPNDDTIDPIDWESLDNLVEFECSHPEPPDDQRVVLLWQAYRKQRAEEDAEAMRHRGNAEQAVTVEEWGRRYDGEGGRLF